MALELAKGEFTAELGSKTNTARVRKNLRNAQTEQKRHGLFANDAHRTNKTRYEPYSLDNRIYD